MSWCRVISRVVGRGCLLWPVHSLGKTVNLCHASVCTPRPNLPVTPCISWLPTFAFQLPMMKRTIFSLLLLGLVGHHRIVQLKLLRHSWLGPRLVLLWYWMVCFDMNRDHSVIFEIAPKYFILNSFVAYEGYSISPKGFLPSLVDIMLIWIKFTHSDPF